MNTNCHKNRLNEPRQANAVSSQRTVSSWSLNKKSFSLNRDQRTQILNVQILVLVSVCVTKINSLGFIYACERNSQLRYISTHSGFRRDEIRVHVTTKNVTAVGNTAVTANVAVTPITITAQLVATFIPCYCHYY